MATQKYVVQKSNIFLGHGKKVKEGEVVELDTKMAKHFAKLGMLAPYIPEDEENDDDDTEPEGNGEGDIVQRAPTRRTRSANPDPDPAPAPSAAAKPL